LCIQLVVRVFNHEDFEQLPNPRRRVLDPIRGKFTQGLGRQRVTGVPLELKAVTQGTERAVPTNLLDRLPIVLTNIGVGEYVHGRASGRLEGVAAVGLRLGQGLWQASHPEIRKLTTERLALGFKSALEMSGNMLIVTLLQSILRKQGRAAVE
jgi:hypothetical protein